MTYLKSSFVLESLQDNFSVFVISFSNKSYICKKINVEKFTGCI